MYSTGFYIIVNFELRKRIPIRYLESESLSFLRILLLSKSRNQVNIRWQNHGKCLAAFKPAFDKIYGNYEASASLLIVVS